MTNALVQRMSDAAGALLAALPYDQRAQATAPLEDTRRDWHYTPRRRTGVAIGDLDPGHAKLVHGLLAAGLSLPAYAKACAIVALEDVLGHLEGHASLVRSTAWYVTSIYGDPGSERWGWRFEGHHVSVNWTICGDQVWGTPLFLGANPAVVGRGTHEASRPLREEEEAARDLLGSLDEEQRAAAVICPRAPSEIVTGNAQRLDGALKPGDVPDLTWEPMDEADRDALEFGAGPRGLSSERMDARQRALLAELVGAYVSRAPVEVAQPEAESLAGCEMHFAWAGPQQRGAQHYYRLESGDFVAEYDNWQNDANHIHAVWRAPSRDFGADLLAAHHAGHGKA